MKKKIIIWGIIFFSFCLFLTSCEKNNNDDNKKDNTEEKDDNKKEKKDDRDNPYIEEPTSYENESALRSIVLNVSYDLIEGDKINPIYEEKRNAYLYKVSDEKIISVNSSGEIEALSKGEAKLRIYKDTATRIKYIGYINFKIEEKEKINYNCSDELIKELNSKMNSYDSNSYSALTKTNINNKEYNTKFIMREDPFYYETIIYGEDGNLGHGIIEKINDNYYSYTIDDNKKTITKTKLIDLDINDDLVNVSINIAELDYDKLELNKISDNEYEIKYYISDMLSVVKKMFNDSDIDSNADGIMNINFKFDNDQIKINIKTKMHIVYANIVLDVPYEINYEFNFDEITEFDSSDYITFAPQTMEECYELDNDFEFYVDSYGKAYSYKHLEAGKYAIEEEDLFYNEHIKINVYDENKNKLDLKDSNIRNIENTFTIPEEGNYYIEMNWGISDSTKLKFIKLDYNVSTEAKLFNSTKGEIKGIYDFNKYYYNSEDENELLKITNNTENSLYLYVENVNCDDWNGNFVISAGDTRYINPKEDSIIYVVSNVPKEHSRNSLNAYQYDFTVESIDASLGRDIDNPILLTEEFSTESYYVSGSLTPLYFKVTAESRGAFEFFGKTEKEGNILLNVLDDENNARYENKVEAGEHIFNYYDNTSDIIVYHFRYEFYDLTDKDVFVELKTKTSEDDTANIYVDSAKSHKEQIVKHHFTLDKDEIIRTYFDEVSIYDSNDKKINFKLSGYGYIKLKAGSYYAIYDGSYSRFVLSKISYNPKTYIDFDNLNKLNLKGLSFNKNQGLDNEILVYEYVPTTDIKLEFRKDNLYLNIIDVDFNKVESSWGEYKFNANEKYYVIIYGISTTWEDATLSINEVN